MNLRAISESEMRLPQDRRAHLTADDSRENADQTCANGYDALITPTVARTRIQAHYDPIRDRPVIGGKAVDPYSGWFLTSVFSLVNWIAGHQCADWPVRQQRPDRRADRHTSL